MTVTCTAPRRRHGRAGLLVALFAVAGLVFSYGLGHGPPPRLCTESAVSTAVGAGAAATGHERQAAAFSPLQGLHKSDDAAFSAPEQAPRTPLHACLCVAVLFALLLLALVTGPRRPLSRLPARAGWSLAPPSAAGFTLAFTSSLQVLRL